MSLYIEDNYGNVITNFLPDTYHWWITGFNSDYQNMNANNLTVYGTINFSENLDLWEGFLNGYSKNKFDEIFDEYCIDEETHTFTYSW